MLKVIQPNVKYVMNPFYFYYCSSSSKIKMIILNNNDITKYPTNHLYKNFIIRDMLLPNTLQTFNHRIIIFFFSIVKSGTLSFSSANIYYPFSLKLRGQFVLIRWMLTSRRWMEGEVGCIDCVSITCSPQPSCCLYNGSLYI